MNKYDKIKRFLAVALIPVVMSVMTCCSDEPVTEGQDNDSSIVAEEQESGAESAETYDRGEPETGSEPEEEKDSSTVSGEKLARLKFKGEPYVRVNGNRPEFSKKERNLKNGYEDYPELDSLGRCRTVIAKIGKDTMPDEERKGIGMIKPAGWHTVRYDDLISDRYLYNRCHLIGFQLAGENANRNNLITGTRYLNVEGMLPFEDEVADYVRNTGNHVIYKVTPVYKGDNLVASGVQMEARSVEDKGRGVSFNVYCFNKQPGIVIDYATGDSRRSGEKAPSEKKESHSSSSSSKADYREKKKYVINTNTGKYHDPSCSSVKQMKDSNKKVMTTTKKRLEEKGYEPCGNCQR